MHWYACLVIQSCNIYLGRDNFCLIFFWLFHINKNVTKSLKEIKGMHSNIFWPQMKSWRGKLCRFIPAAFVLIEGMVSKWFILVEKYIWYAMDRWLYNCQWITNFFWPFQNAIQFVLHLSNYCTNNLFSKSFVEDKAWFHMLKTKGKTRSVKLW